MSKTSGVEELGHEAEWLGQAIQSARRAEELQDLLRDAFELISDGSIKVRTFEEAGVLTYDKGLVVQMEDTGAEFQITIVRSGAAQ